MVSKYIALDFETRSLCDLPKKGAYLYCKSKYTEPLVLTYKIQGKKVKCITENIEDACKMLFEKYFSKGYIFVAHNVYFDKLLFERFGECKVKNFACTSLMSLVAGGPKDLSSSAHFFKLSDKKLVIGKHLIKVFSIPRRKDGRNRISLDGEKLETRGAYLWNDNLFEKFKEYAIFDTKVCAELFERLYEFHIYIKDNKINLNNHINFLRNKKGIRVDEKLLGEVSEELLLVKGKIEKQAQKVSGKKNFNINSPMQVRAFIDQYEGVSIPNLNRKKLLVFLKKYKKQLPDELFKILFLRYSYPTTAVSKYKSIKERIYKGRVKSNFICFGAGQTGRYTESGVNFLNLPRGLKEEQIKDVVSLLKKGRGQVFKKHKFKSQELLKGMVRPLLIPAEGMDFIGGDFSQIELRLLLYVCKEYEALEKCFNGFDWYVHFGKKVYGREITDQERYVAKRGTLAFGYGNGAESLIEILHDEGVVADIHTTTRLRNAYMTAFPKIRMYWRHLEKKFPEVEVPFTGRKLIYPEVDGKSYLSSTRSRTKVWGAKLCGHVIQSLARDLFAYKERDLFKKLGFLTLLPVHDEFLGETDDLSVEKFKSVLEKPPKWLKSEYFPRIDCDVWKGRRYLK